MEPRGGRRQGNGEKIREILLLHCISYTDDITETLPDPAVYRLTPSRIGERTDVVQLTSIAAGQLIETYTAFCDNDTILLATGKEAWTYHIPTGALVCTVADGTGLRPIESRRLALSVDETGSVSIADLTTGGRVKLEGINGNGEFICKANGIDTKLLWAEWSKLDGYHATSIDRLGVIDLETGEFTAFDREHQEELSGSTGWGTIGL